MTEQLETARLTIRPMPATALAGLRDRYAAEDPELSEAYAAMLAGCTAQPQQALWYTAWDIRLRATGESIGDLCFKGLPEHGRPEIGYGLLPPYHGKGYATEAVEALCRWALSQTGVTAVEAETTPDNAASQRVLEKVGFFPCGITGEEGPRFLLPAVTEAHRIGPMPAIVYGAAADRVFLFIHGQCGNKEEAARFAAVAIPRGWQVLSVDLPEHGERRDASRLLPWVVLPELQAVLHNARTRWPHIAVRANSIGAWFSLLAFAGAADQRPIERCLLVSPLTDMEAMIRCMMAQAGVTEQQLVQAEEIPTATGQTLSAAYLRWAQAHPVRALCPDTAILCAGEDAVLPPHALERFVQENGCRRTVMPNGEHWFHTPEQLAFQCRFEAAELDRPTI